MSESINTPEPQGSAIEETSPQVEKKTPNKRGRLTFIERAQKESEELVKNMGGSLELEGGRRTRSSARGTPSRSAVDTPPPVKKARNSPASPKSAPRARGRGRKLETTKTPEPPEQQQNKEKEENVETKTPISAENDAAEEESPEKPETNGPEKSTDEHDNDVVPEKSKNAEAEPQKIEKEEIVVKNKKVADQVDAGLITAQEKQGSLSEAGEPEKPKDSVQEKQVTPIVAAVDSPMDVDEQSSTQEAAVVQHEVSKSDSVEISDAEAKLATNTVESKSSPSVKTVVEAVAVEKQPTPEPMEVDSSSKSSDVIECTDVVDKSESIISSAQVESISSVEKPSDKPVPIVLVNDSPPTGAEKVAEIVTPSQANSEKNGTTGDVDLTAVKENDISVAPIVAEVKSAGVPAATEESKIESVIESKTENNIDEPKVTSPQLSAAGDAVVTTI